VTPSTQEREAVTIVVPMADGVTLAATRFPAPTSPAPAIVMLTPYRKEPFNMSLAQFGLEGLGCEIIIADVRGTGGSGGEWDGPLSPREISDGVELLDWVEDHDFCDGQTALIGPSYLGLNTLLIAAQKPRSLRCIAAIVPPVDLYRDMYHRGGIPSHTNWGAMVGYSNQHRPEVQRRILNDFYLATVADPYDGERCRSRSVEDFLGEIEVPTLLFGGWYDYFLRGTLRAFPRVRAPKRLVLGNSGHASSLDAPQLKDEVVGWFSYWLRGHGTDPSNGANVVLQTVGTGGWESHQSWPAASEIDWERWQPLAAPTPIRVTIGFEAPLTSEPPVPLLERVTTDSGMSLWGEVWTADTMAVESPTRYRGPVALKAVLTSEEATDLDLHARISIVRADGAIHQVSEGRLRASHRALDIGRSELTADGEIAVPWHPHDRAQPLPIGEPVTLDVEIFPINLELARGESLRLGITLVRADEVVASGQVTLLPETHVLLPRAGE